MTHLAYLEQPARQARPETLLERSGLSPRIIRTLGGQGRTLRFQASKRVSRIFGSPLSPRLMHELRGEPGLTSPVGPSTCMELRVSSTNLVE